MVEKLFDKDNTDWRLLHKLDKATLTDTRGQITKECNKTWFATCELAILSNTRCYVCDGYGHSWKDCPTAARLRAYGASGGDVRSIVSRLLTEQKVDAKGGHQFSTLVSTLRK